MKTDGHLRRNYLNSRPGDAANVILSADSIVLLKIALDDVKPAILRRRRKAA